MRHREAEQTAEGFAGETQLHSWALCLRAVIPKGLARLLAR